MKHILSYLTLALVLLSLSACHSKEEESVSDGKADALFSDLCHTYISYTDSLKQLDPSDTLQCRKSAALIENFEDRMWRIYRKYPADLDMQMSESQNDSIWKIVQVYLRQRSRFSNPQAEPDSIVSDTTAIQEHPESE